MDNLNEIGLTELSEKSLEETTGGIALALQLDISDVTSTVGGLLESLLGVVGGLGGLLGGGGVLD